MAWAAGFRGLGLGRPYPSPRTPVQAEPLMQKLTLKGAPMAAAAAAAPCTSDVLK
jgi:hypothetical protein